MTKKISRDEALDALANYWNQQPHMNEGGSFQKDLGTVMSLGGTDLLFGGNTNPQNTFQAVAPTTTNYDWTTGMNQAAGQANEGYRRQGDLANALTDQAAGRGPSLANMQLQQATNQNMAAAASQAASARGLNPAQAARMAGMNQANIQQQAAGQSAMTKLQEQRSAQQQLGNVLAQQRGGSQQMYGTNVGGLGAQNANVTSGQLGAQAINARTASENVQGQRGLIGGLLGGFGSSMQYAEGGEAGYGFDYGQELVDAYAPVDYAAPNPSMRPDSMSIASSGAPEEAITSPVEMDDPDAAPDAAKKKGGGDGKFWINMLLKLGMTQALMPKSGPAIPRAFDEGGEVEIPEAGTTEVPEDPAEAANSALSLASGGAKDDTQGNLSALTSILALFDNGGEVPGKAKYAGDDLRNDVVPAVLSKKEIVLPRSVTLADDAPKKAAEFVAAIKNQEQKGASQDYGDSMTDIESRLARLEGLLRPFDGKGAAVHLSEGGSPCGYCVEKINAGQEPPFHPNCRCG